MTCATLRRIAPTRPDLKGTRTVMRSALIALTCLAALPAAAQTPAPTTEIGRATVALGAMWRPLDGPITSESIRAACAGSEQEMQALDAAMPSELNEESAARVRGLRGLHIIPIARTPGAAYFFPPLNMPWFNSGLGDFGVINEAAGSIGVHDSSGQELAFEVGRAGTHPMLRIRRPTGEVIIFAGCQPIAPLE
jgi:hypothetical protein